MPTSQSKSEIRAKFGRCSPVVPREAHKVTPVCTIILLLQVAILALAYVGGLIAVSGWQTLRASRGYQSSVRSSIVPIAKALLALLLPPGRQIAYAEHYERRLDPIAIHSNPRTHKPK